MLQNILGSFSGNVVLFITGESKGGKGLLVKKHCENLQTHGEFSFPNTVKSWHEYLVSKGLSSDRDVTLMSYIGKEIMDLVQDSKNWVLEVKNCKEDADRVYLFLERPKAIRSGMLEAIHNNELISRHILEGTSRVLCDPEYMSKTCITSLRLRYLCKVIQNLCSINRKCQDLAPTITVTARSHDKNDGRMVLCGAVLNAKTGVKETLVSADDFIR